MASLKLKMKNSKINIKTAEKARVFQQNKTNPAASKQKYLARFSSKCPRERGPASCPEANQSKKLSQAMPNLTFLIYLAPTSL